MATDARTLARRLARIKRTLGHEAHADAVHRALAAVGRAALVEAERRARLRPRGVRAADPKARG